MSFVIKCPCGQQMTVEDEYVGKNVACVKCTKALVVPNKPIDETSIADAQFAENQPSPSYGSSTPTGPGTTPYMTAHRGTLVLILGILSLICCGLFTGIPAWILGNADMKEMKAGRMDPSGESLTNVGRILGIIGTIWNVVVFVGYILFFIFVGVTGLSGY